MRTKPVEQLLKESKVVAERTAYKINNVVSEGLLAYIKYEDALVAELATRILELERENKNLKEAHHAQKSLAFRLADEVEALEARLKQDHDAKLYRVEMGFPRAQITGERGRK